MEPEEEEEEEDMNRITGPPIIHPTITGADQRLGLEHHEEVLAGAEVVPTGGPRIGLPQEQNGGEMNGLHQELNTHNPIHPIRIGQHQTRVGRQPQVQILIGHKLQRPIRIGLRPLPTNSTRVEV